MQGKLIGFVPLLKDGVQETYNGKNGLLYKFTVTIETDGKHNIGTTNSTKTTPSWKIGEQYTYDLVINGNYTNINSLKSLDQQNGGGFGAKVPNPEFGIQKAFEAAMECTFKFFELNPDIYTQAAEDAVLDKIWIYMLNGSESRRWINMSSMRLTLLKMQANGLFSKTEEMKITTCLFDTATLIANTMENAVKAQVETDKQNKAAGATAPH